jgi:methylenetetrahydrofolate reductase (NADPH)
VHRQFDCPVASHLTCVGATVDQLRDYLRDASRRGIDFIVALRGDPPKDQTEFRPPPGGLRYANELVALVRAEFPQFGVAVAGYPETHVEATSPQADLENLKRKVEAGADVVITQLFYRNDDFFRFRERCAHTGIAVPIVPGILPITSFTQIRRISSLCGATLPTELATALESHDGCPESQFDIGVEFATRQVQGLVDAGVPGVHFFVLNKSPATCCVLRAVTRPA